MYSDPNLNTSLQKLNLNNFAALNWNIDFPKLFRIVIVVIQKYQK